MSHAAILLGDLAGPMVAKEIRQVLRARSFMAPFLVVPLLAASTVAIEAHTQRTGSAFWMLAAVALAVPAVAVWFSVRAERKRRTYELVLVSGLSPWRIFSGKWAASVLASALLAAALLPFLVARYQLGRVELGAQARALSALLGASFFLGALGLALSVARPNVLKLVLVGCFGLAMLPFVFLLSGLAVYLLGWMIGGSGLGAVNGLVLGLLPLVLVARVTTPVSERLPLAGRTFDIVLALIMLAAAQGAVFWPPALVATLALAPWLTVRLVAAGIDVPPLPDGAPAALRRWAEAWGMGGFVLGAGLAAVAVGWVLAHPVPGPSRLFYATALLGALAAPLALVLLARRWFPDSGLLLFLLFQLLGVGLGLAFPAAAPAVPTAAFVLTLLGHGQDEWFPWLAGIAAVAVPLAAELLRRAALRDAKDEVGDHAGVA